jgi:hypothetical protein
MSEFSVTDEKITYISKQFHVRESHVKLIHKIFLTLLVE